MDGGLQGGGLGTGMKLVITIPDPESPAVTNSLLRSLQAADFKAVSAVMTDEGYEIVINEVTEEQWTELEGMLKQLGVVYSEVS